MKIRLLSSFLLFLGVWSINNSVGAVSLEAPSQLRVIALTDLHGALESQVLQTKSGEKVKVGGAALLASYVKVLQESDGIPSIILDAGDLFQGSLVSNTAEGKPVIDFYNYLGVDAAAVGNHDFDYGPEGKKTTPSGPEDDPRGALKARARQARFPFLAANMVQADGVVPSWARSSVLIEKSGIKIGVIGFASVETPRLTHIKNLTGLRFIDPVGPIQTEATALRQLGAQYILLIGHAGGGCKENSPSKWDDLSSCDDGELFQTLSRLPAGTVDLAVGGHTHQGISKNYHGVAVIQSYSNSKFVGSVLLSKVQGHVQAAPGLLQEVCEKGVPVRNYLTCSPAAVKEATLPAQEFLFLGQQIKEDQNVIALLQSDFDRVQEIKDRPIGVTLNDSFKRSYFDENPLGNFLADALKGYFTELDLVALNNGGLRGDLPAGPLSYGDIFNVLPFDNLFAILHVDGKTLKKMMEIGVSRKSGGISWSGGEFVADKCLVSEVTVNERPLEQTHLYQVLTTDFLALGGSHFDLLELKVEQIEILSGLPSMRDLTAEALQGYRGPFHSHEHYDPKSRRQKIKDLCIPVASHE